MKKIIFIMLIIFGIVYANTPKSCKVLQEPNPDLGGIAFMDINKSIKACTKAIEDNPNEVQYWYDLGSAYESNSNSKEAFYWYSKAAAKGHTSAQYSMGTIYNYGRGIKEDKEKAMTWYLKASDNNHSWARYEIGDMHQQGKGVKKDIKTALSWYIKSADLNNSSALVHIGDMYYEGKDVKQNYNKALAWYIKAAENNTLRYKDGNSNAQVKIADMYYDGIGVEKDYKQAFKWFMRAAKQGYIYAQASIGYMYANGEWATKNYNKALNWYMKAAERGNIDAQIVVSNMFLNGQGTKKSYKKAFKWCMKAAEQGSAQAQGTIGFMYHKGWGVGKNNRKSFQWFMKAAMQGYEKAQTIVGSSYYEGDGVKKNYIKAYAWLNLAMSKDIEEKTRKQAKSVFNVLEIVMTPEQIEIAQNYDPLKQNKEIENQPASKNKKFSQRYIGTGFFVDKSTVLTNHHVVKNCKSIELIRSGYTSAAKIKAKDSVNDLVILEADKTNNSSLKFRAGKGIRIGDNIIVIGYPLGELLGSGIKVTTGNVSALTGLINDTTSMQLTAPVQPGNSGGALLDSSGNVVGVIVARLKKEQNVNLAIKANVAQMFLDINSVDYGVSMSKDKKDVADIADEVKGSIVQVVCYQ